MLLAKLLSQSDIESSAEADLLTLLRSQVPAPTPAISTDAVQNLTTSLQSVQQTLATLSERVASLESTCKGQAQGIKRKHDDQDDPDHHEGEKRMRTIESDSSLLEPETVTATTTGTGTSEAQTEIAVEATVGEAEKACPEAESSQAENLMVEKPEGNEGEMVEITVMERPALDIIDLDSEIEPEIENLRNERAIITMNAEVNELFHVSDNEAQEQQDYDQYLLQNEQNAESQSEMLAKPESSSRATSTNPQPETTQVQLNPPVKW